MLYQDSIFPEWGKGVIMACLIAVWLSGCYLPAGHPAAIRDGSSTDVPDIPLPTYSGPKVPIAVLPLGLSKQAAERYPRLREQAVGLGVHNVLVETLYETKGFTLVEEKADIVRDILKRQWASSTGAISERYAIEIGNMTGARYIAYGEVYDFGVRSRGESRGVYRTRTDTVTVGVQIRIVSVSTGEFIPASGSGQAGVISKGLIFGDDTSRFEECGVGKATRLAIRKAVAALMKRFPETL